MRLLEKVGRRWRIPPMGGVPVGFEWTAIYPIMERMGLNDDDWNDLHDAMAVLEDAALEVIREFAPKD